LHLILEDLSVKICCINLLNMKKLVPFLLIILLQQNVFSQNVGIGTSWPNASAALDIVNGNKGILLPRVSLLTLTDAATITAPANGLLLYNINGALEGGKGFYYNTGTTGAPQWARLSTGAGQGLQLPYSNVGTWPGNAFAITNNNSTNPTAAISGTSASGSGIAGNTTSGKAIYGSASGTGTAVYAYAQTISGTALNVVGKLKIEGTTSIAQGKVLTSDANGFATWQGSVAFAATGILAGGSVNMSMDETKLAFATELYDIGADYADASAANHSTFTAPEAGIYHFDAQVTWDAGNYIGGGAIALYRKQFNTYMIARCGTTLNKNFPVSNISVDVKLSAGEQVYVTGHRNTPGAVALLGHDGYTYFNGRMVIKL
jgi:hypothetical protein